MKRNADYERNKGTGNHTSNVPRKSQTWQWPNEKEKS